MPLKPTLAALLVGDDPSSRLYLFIKEKRAKVLGVSFKKILLSLHTSQEELEDVIEELNRDKSIHGILLQLPLPHHLNPNRAVGVIDPLKDVDGFHWDSGVKPPVVLAIRDLLLSSEETLQGKRAKLFIKGDHFYKRVTNMLQEEGIEVVENSLEADIVITAQGKASFLKASMVKKGSIVIDVGINRKRGKTVGDAAPDVGGKAGYMSPVPGGVGPLTVANLFVNFLELVRQSLARESPLW